MTTTREYVFRILEVVRVVDGDSYWFRVDTGLRHSALINVRLLGYDTPERTKGSERERLCGRRAADIAASFLYAFIAAPDNGSLWVRTAKDPDDFGRWLGEVWHETADGSVDVYLGSHLRDQHLASVWPTRWRDEFDRNAA